MKEEKDLLKQYENKSYLFYGRQAQDLQSHTAVLIRRHEQTVAADMKEAVLHQMASKLDETNAGPAPKAWQCE